MTTVEQCVESQPATRCNNPEPTKKPGPFSTNSLTLSLYHHQISSPITSPLAGSSNVTTNGTTKLTKKEYSLTANTFTQDDMEKIRSAFDKYDSEQQNSVSLFKLIFIFNELGQTVTESQLLELLDDSMNASIVEQNIHSETESIQHSARLSESIPGSPHPDASLHSPTYGGNPGAGQNNHSSAVDYSKYQVPFHTFLKMLENHRERQEARNTELDMLNAFVSMGGNPNGTGYIKARKIKSICDEFGLTVDINELLKSMDEKGVGKIRFGSFKKALTTDLQLE